MNSFQRFEHRANTQIISLSETTQEFPAPECLRLQLTPKVMKKPLDIGSFAYFIRANNQSCHDDRGTPVVIESFVESRRELIRIMLESFVGQRDKTVLTYFKAINYFVDWLNTQGYREVFSSAAQAQQAYQEFTAHLFHRIAHQDIKPISAANYQNKVARTIELLYPENSHYILAGAVKITGARGSEGASVAHVELYKDVFLAIARQCSAFILNNNPYPLVVTIRDYEVVGFPSTVGWVGPFKASPRSYNAAERRVATVEEYWSACDILGRKRAVRSVLVKDLAATQDGVDAANGDQRHWHRLKVAALAAKAYASLLLMTLGATPTEFAQFSYADALAVEKSPLKKELSAVKFRASGKKNSYNVGRYTGLSLLKEYLKLREWILNGATYDRLFFTITAPAEPVSANERFAEFDASESLDNFFASISGVFIDPKVPRLSPRKMRKSKSIGAHTAGIAPDAVAASMNHTKAVNFSTYAEATPEQQEAEFGQFWQAVRHAADVVRERSERPAESKIPTAAGHCDGFNQPIKVRDLGVVAIEPNCRTQYGCLYCEHYICHSDEEDLHKLLSLQYVINAVRKTAPDAAHAEVLYQELSIRIEFILEALGERSDAVKKTVEVVKEKVFKYGELTAFWERRLSRYEQMGVVL